MRLFTRSPVERMGVATRSVRSWRPRVTLHRNAKTTPHTRRCSFIACAPCTGPSRPPPRPRGLPGGRPTNGSRGIATGANGPRRSLVAAASPAPAHPGGVCQRDPRGAPATAPGLAIARRLQVPRSTVAVDLGAGRLGRLRYLDPAPPVVRSSGRSRASSCISISSRWRASGASAIASMGPAADPSPKRNGQCEDLDKALGAFFASA